MAFVDDALAGDAGGHRGLQHLGDAGQARREVHAAQAGVDADAQLRGRPSRAEGALEGGLVEGSVGRAERRTVERVRLDEQVVGNDHGRPAPVRRTAPGLKRLADARPESRRRARPRTTPLVTGCSRPACGSAVDLEAAVFVAAGHVADDADHRHAVEQRLADALTANWSRPARAPRTARPACRWRGRSRRPCRRPRTRG